VDKKKNIERTFKVTTHRNSVNDDCREPFHFKLNTETNMLTIKNNTYQFISIDFDQLRKALKKINKERQ
jgi:hypothetical protein